MVGYGLMLMTALMVTLLAMPLATRLGYLAGMVDQPDVRKVHTAVMPRSGGIAIALGVCFTILSFDFSDRNIQAMMLGALIMIVTGVMICGIFVRGRSLSGKFWRPSHLSGGAASRCIRWEI